MSQIKLLVALALLIILTILIMGGQVPVHFLGYNVPLILIVISSLFVGALLSALLAISEAVGLKKTIKKQKKEIGELNEKVEKLQLRIREFEEKEEDKDSSKA